MKKLELFEIYNKALQVKKMNFIDGVNASSKKSTLQQAIDCLECSDETITNWLEEISKEFPNVGSKIKDTEYLTHSFNRMFIYTTAKLILV